MTSPQFFLTAAQIAALFELRPHGTVRYSRRRGGGNAPLNSKPQLLGRNFLKTSPVFGTSMIFGEFLTISSKAVRPARTSVLTVSFSTKRCRRRA